MWRRCGLWNRSPSIRARWRRPSPQGRGRGAASHAVVAPAPVLTQSAGGGDEPRAPSRSAPRPPCDWQGYLTRSVSWSERTRAAELDGLPRSANQIDTKDTDWDPNPRTQAHPTVWRYGVLQYKHTTAVYSNEQEVDGRRRRQALRRRRTHRKEGLLALWTRRPESSDSTLVLLLRLPPAAQAPPRAPSNCSFVL